MSTLQTVKTGWRQAGSDWRKFKWRHPRLARWLTPIGFFYGLVGARLFHLIDPKETRFIPWMIGTIILGGSLLCLTAAIIVGIDFIIARILREQRGRPERKPKYRL